MFFELINHVFLGLEKTGLIPHLHKRGELDLVTGQDLEPQKEGLPHPQCRLLT